MSSREIYIKVTKDGPFLVYGAPKISEKTIVVDDNKISVSYSEGEIYTIDNEPVALCRCGCSANAPFCDGAHKKINFDGTETATFDLILNGAEKIEGPNYTLMDNIDYCAFARFCDAGGQIWNLITVGNPETDKLAIREAFDCPAGRLIILDKDGNQIEPEMEKAVSPLEDSGLRISGPLWVQGGIRVESASGRSYEVRNKQTLCRCGKSDNKPFCNGAHASIKFKAQKKRSPKA